MTGLEFRSLGTHVECRVKQKKELPRWPECFSDWEKRVGLRKQL